MSDTDRADSIPRDLKRILPMLALGDDFAVVTPTLRAEGKAITPALRNELLAKLQAGEYVELTVDLAPAYEQKAGAANRKFVRFRDGLMTKLGASFKGKPFLRDHDQGSVLARGGTIVTSATEKRGEGDYAINMSVTLTAPWAVDSALRGNLDRVSIGWWPTGAIECSVCGTQVGTKCYHWPGDRVAEVVGSDGSKQYVRDRAGDRIVEWVFTAAEGIETSAVNVPAVPGAGIEEIRAALSAAFPDEVDGTGIRPVTPVQLAGSSGEGAARGTPSQSQELIMPGTTETQPQTAPQAPALAAPDINELAKARAIEIRAEERACASTVRETAKRHALDLSDDEVDAIVLAADRDVKTARLAVLDRLDARSKKAPINPSQVTLVSDQADKRRNAAGIALTHRAFQASGLPSSVEKARRAGIAIPTELELPKLNDETLHLMRRKSLVELGADYLASRGIDPRHMDSATIAERVLSSGSDFPLLLADAMNKILMAPFVVRPSPWRNFAREVPARDFKTIKFLRRSSAPPVKKLESEDAEVKYGGYSERQETAELETYAGGVKFSRKLFINDDLGAFATQTLGLGDSINDNRDDVVCGVVTGSDNLADGHPLFHSAHANISATTGTDITAIEAAEDKMASQIETRRDGTTRKLNYDVECWFGARSEMVAVDKVVNPSGYLPSAATNAAGGMSLNKPTYWDQRLALTPRYYYGICASRTGLVFGGLQGSSAPKFSSAIDFDTEGAKFKALDDFYAGLDSWEWIVRVALS